MANMLSPLEALSYVQQQGEMGRQRGQQNQLAQLAGQSYTAQPDQQQAILGQMAAINPQAAQATQQQFQGQEDRRMQKLAGAARYLEQARQTNNPQAVQGAWNAVRPMLTREMPQGQFPEQWDDATMAPTLYQVLAQTGGGAQGQVQSVRVGDDGYYYNVMRDGRFVNTGVRSNPNIKVLEQEGQVPIGIVTSGGVAGQTIPLGAAQTPQPQGAYIDPSLPPEVQAQIRQSLSSGQEPPGQMVFGGQPGASGLARTPTSVEKAAAEAAARRQVELSTLPAELGMRTNAAIQQAGGTAEVTAQAKNRAELEATQAERQRSAQDTLSLLDQAERILPNATGGRGGQFVDAAAGLVGASTPGAQATAQLQTIAGQLTSKMPRMQGPQSDRDVQLYQQMAGDLANPTIPVETRMAALRTIRQLNQKYANGGQASGRTVVRTGTLPNGRKVIQYSDGTTDYGN
jgi:hypothetical protein